MAARLKPTDPRDRNPGANLARNPDREVFEAVRLKPNDPRVIVVIQFQSALALTTSCNGLGAEHMAHKFVVRINYNEVTLAVSGLEQLDGLGFHNVPITVTVDPFYAFEVCIAEEDAIHGSYTVLSLYYSVESLCVQASVYINRCVCACV